MKTTQFIYAGFLLLFWSGFMGCDLPEKVDPPSLSDLIEVPADRDPMEWRVDNGTLVFIDDAHLAQGKRLLAAMDDSSRTLFEDGLGFRSISSIMYLIAQEEEVREDQYYGALPDYLTVAQYDSLGYGNYVEGPAYQDAEQAGIIETIYEQDSTSYFQSTVKAPDMLNILNNRGEVIVGEIRYTYAGSTRQGTNIVTGASTGIDTIGKNTGTQTNFNGFWHLGGPTSLPFGSSLWITSPCNDRQRYSAKMSYSCTFTNKVLKPYFYFMTSSQVYKRKKWKKEWVNDPEYKPFWGITGTWKYRIRLKVNGSNVDYECPPETMNGQYPPSPYSQSNLNKSNQIPLYLDPTGPFEIPSFVNVTFRNNAELFDGQFTFKFSGCSNGNSYDIQF